MSNAGALFFFLFHPLTSVALDIHNIVWLWIWIKRGILNVIGKFLFLPYIYITGEKERYWKSKNNFITYSFKMLKTMLWVGQSLVYFARFCKKIKIFKEYQFANGHKILFLSKGVISAFGLVFNLGSFMGPFALSYQPCIIWNNNWKHLLKLCTLARHFQNRTFQTSGAFKMNTFVYLTFLAHSIGLTRKL